LGVLLAKYFESRYNLVVLNKHNRYRKRRIISSLIFLELLLKGAGFVVRVLDGNQGSSGFRLYIKRGEVLLLLLPVYLPQVFRGVSNTILRVELVGFVLV
jgi:hypothetical protein